MTNNENAPRYSVRAHNDSPLTLFAVIETATGDYAPDAHELEIEQARRARGILNTTGPVLFDNHLNQKAYVLGTAVMITGEVGLWVREEGASWMQCTLVGESVLRDCDDYLALCEHGFPLGQHSATSTCA